MYLRWLTDLRGNLSISGRTWNVKRETIASTHWKMAWNSVVRMYIELGGGGKRLSPLEEGCFGI